MAMNPRLLRPTSSSLDRDAAVYLNAVAAADGEQLEPAVKKAINDFVKGCKADGIWDAIKASCILAGARTLAGALVPLKGTAPTNNGPFVTGDYDRETGLVGNGTTKFLDSNRLANADPKLNHHYGVFVHTVGEATGFKTYIGSNSTVANDTSSIRRSNTEVDFESRTFVNVRRAGLAASTGLYGLSRNSSTSLDTRVNGVTTATNNNAANDSTVSFYVFANNGTGAVNDQATGITASRLSFYSIGESLDLADLDTRVSALITAIGAAL